MKADNIQTILAEHVANNAVDYCLSLWKKYPFEIKITKSRHTKVGDFTSRKSLPYPRITLNNDLNPHLFLLTYIHEVAHLFVHKKHSNRVESHGEEWKNEFRELMIPLLQECAFPSEILHELERHMINPKASSFADVDLTRALRNYDLEEQKLIVLSGIPEGSIFSIRKRFFRKGRLRRTRFLCQEIKSKRNYLVPCDALVSNVQLSLL